MRQIKQKLATGELVRVFSVARVLHPMVVEMFGHAGGFDGFWIDQEHGGATYDQMHVLSLAGRANDLESFVRMAPTDYATVTQCLEAGTGGIMGAQIQSVAQADQFVRWSHFPPRGERGLNTGGHDGRHTYLPPAEFVDQAQENTFVAIQIETSGALDQVDEIAALDDVDLLFIGPSDLSMAIGVVGQFHSDRMWEAMSAVATAAANRGTRWGVLPPDPEFAERAVDAGCTLLSIANDPLIMRRGIAAFQEAFGNVF